VNTKKKIMNWGVIGTGSIAQEFAKDLSLAKERQEIVAVMGHKKDSADEFAASRNINAAYTTLNDFLSHKGLDAVYVASPHTLHHEQALACLKKGLPVLCEKPMTINADQCKELVKASVKHKAFLMEGMWIRFLPSITQVLKMIGDGMIGNIISIKASMCYRAPQDSHNRYFDPALGGGSLLDLGVYPVYLSHLLLGKPDTIKAIGTLSDEGVDETCSVLLHYRNGQHAVLESSIVAGTDLPAEIAGEKGTIKILNPWFEKAGGIEVDLYENGKIVYPCQWEGHGLQYEIDEVVECVSQGKIESDKMPHAFSLDMIQTMDEVRNQIQVTYAMYE